MDIYNQITGRMESDGTPAPADAADPVKMPTGVECPVLVLTDADGKGWGVVADGGDLLTYQDHASPRPDQAEIAKRIQATRDDRRALRDDLKASKTALQALSVSAFTAAQKTLLNAIIGEMQRMRRILAAVVKGEV